MAVSLLLAACQAPLPAAPPGGDATPCTRATAVAADTVVLVAGACNPWCVVTHVGSVVYFTNHDAVLHDMVADPALPYDLPVPPGGTLATLPLAAGTVTWTSVHQPSATVTLFVE